MQGKTSSTAHLMLDEAHRLERAGAFSVVLKCVPWQLAELITKQLEILTISVGAEPCCDGQVLVLYDLLGITERCPKFVKRYANPRGSISRVLKNFRMEAKAGKFLTIEHSY